ncbi:MAG: ribonuclease III [Gammaproteobacteria bacterium]|nr:ribonuclease III [Gammaproteobacteria bacterium]
MAQDNALTSLCHLLEYTFEDESLLVQALTHRSAASVNNERLEFLGDGILNFVIAARLFEQYPDMQEGDLSRLRASLVNKDSLADIARSLQLGEYIKLGSGELKSGGRRRDSILADAVESILGAVFLDSGFDTCRRLVLHLYADKLQNIPDVNALKDAKTRLQELLQSRKYPLPVYNVVDVSGKAHNQVFTVECVIEKLGCITTATGGSRRKAEQIAAELAIEEVSRKIAS